MLLSVTVRLLANLTAQRSWTTSEHSNHRMDPVKDVDLRGKKVVLLSVFDHWKH